RNPGTRKKLDPRFRGDTAFALACEGLVNPALSLQEIAVPPVGGGSRGSDLARRGGKVDRLVAGGAPGLALGLERLPDHRGVRVVVVRPGAEHALARGAVDRDHADALRGAEGDDR